MMLRLALLALILSPSVVAADPPSRTLQPMDVFALQWADNPRISPDGRRVVYQRMFFDAMKDVRRSNLWLVDVDSGLERPLTTGSVRDGAASWAPDGKRIAYVAADGDATQVYVKWVDGGETARVTQLPKPPGNLAWSPDGRWLAFTMDVAAKSTPIAELPAPPEGAEWAKPPRVVDRLTYRVDGGGYVDPAYTQLFVVAANGGAVRQLTHGERNVDGVPAWTADGRSLVVAANLADDWEFDALESDLYRVSVNDGTLTRLTTRDGPDNQAVVSPNGKLVAYVGFEDRQLGNQNNGLYVLDIASGESRALLPGFDYDIGSPSWDGNRGIYFQYDSRGDGRIGWVGVGGGEPRVVASDFGGTAMGRPYGAGAMSSAQGVVAYTRSTPYLPAEVAIARGGKTRSLTALNANLLDHKSLGKVEEIVYRSSADGREIQGWLVYPPGFDASRKYPLLLEIHGGPFANYGPRFAPETQLYAATGYVVLYVNPRGSTSYGQDFANLIHHDYPGRDYDDLMSGVDAAVAKGFVDERNLFVTGGSGGGALTAWIVGHTNRFRAAIVAKPVINWYSFVLTGDFSELFTRYWFPARPWEQPEHYLKRSPISYVGQVQTPTMLITGESDLRTPSTEAEQFYTALKMRKVDAVMVRIPGASHNINARPSQMLAQVLYTIGWCEKYRVKD